MRVNAPNANPIKEIVRIKLLGILKRLIVVMVKRIYPLIQGKTLKPEECNRPVREFHRVLTLMIDRWDNQGMKKKWEMIRDIGVFVAEYDNGYLAPLVDILSEIDMEEIKLKYLVPPKKTKEEYFCDYLRGGRYYFGKKHEGFENINCKYE